MVTYATTRQLNARQKWEQALTEQHGDPPINIFTRLRTKEGLSHQSLADKIGCSKQSLIRNEQATFTRPLPVVVSYYINHSSRDLFQTELFLMDNYENFQEAQRLRYRELFGPSLQTDPYKSLHPFRQLRLGTEPIHGFELNPTEIAKYLCVSQATIEHFEKKWRTQQSVPKQLVEVLHEIGYTFTQIREFSRTYLMWREFNKNKPKLESYTGYVVT